MSRMSSQNIPQNEQRDLSISIRTLILLVYIVIAFIESFLYPSLRCIRNILQNAPYSTANYAVLVFLTFAYKTVPKPKVVLILRT